MLVCIGRILAFVILATDQFFFYHRQYHIPTCFLLLLLTFSTERVTDLREGRLTLLTDEECARSSPVPNSVNLNSTVCAGYASGMISGCQVCIVAFAVKLLKSRLPQIL